jgi:hypothetical protein
MVEEENNIKMAQRSPSISARRISTNENMANVTTHSELSTFNLGTWLTGWNSAFSLPQSCKCIATVYSSMRLSLHVLEAEKTRYSWSDENPHGTMESNI